MILLLFWNLPNIKDGKYWESMGIASSLNRLYTKFPYPMWWFTELYGCFVKMKTVGNPPPEPFILKWLGHVLHHFYTIWLVWKPISF